MLTAAGPLKTNNVRISQVRDSKTGKQQWFVIRQFDGKWVKEGGPCSDEFQAYAKLSGRRLPVPIWMKVIFYLQLAINLVLLLMILVR